MSYVVQLVVFAFAELALCGPILWYLCAPPGSLKRAPLGTRRSRVRGIPRLVSGLLIVLVVLGIVAHGGPLLGESTLRTEMDVVTDTSPLVLLVQLVDQLDTLRLWLVADVALALYLVFRGVWRAGVIVLAGALATETATALLLVTVGRARPDALVPLRSVWDALSAGSFPPGPAARSFVTIGVALMIISRYAGRWWRSAFILGALLVALEGLVQVVGVEHWPTDVLGGFLEGGVSLGAIALGWRWSEDWAPRASERTLTPVSTHDG